MNEVKNRVRLGYESLTHILRIHHIPTAEVAICAWEETGKITLASQKANVNPGLFYYWKARFDEKGYAALEEYESHKVQKLNKTDESIAQKEIEMRRTHGDWGKRRIVEELAKTNNWEQIVSANTALGISLTPQVYDLKAVRGKKRMIKVLFEMRYSPGRK